MSDDNYDAPTAEELAALPTVFRDDLFKDHVVLVSGGAGGIGMATAVLFGRLGATIVSCSRDEGKMAAFEAAMASIHVPCFTKAMTIRDADQVSDLMAGAFARQWQDGQLDGHRQWIAVLLEKYYDPMYEYQLSQRSGEQLFVGNRQAVIASAQRHSR